MAKLIDPKDCEWDNNGNIIYKGVTLPITRENIEDYRFQTAMDPDEFILFTYNNMLSVKRNNKINQILGDE
jgi:hypothetical protein